MIRSPELEDTIMQVVGTLGRNSKRVFPRMVYEQAAVYHCERTVRRYMVKLADEEKLQRLGKRKGYRVIR